jgi:hypothetical protein
MKFNQKYPKRGKIGFTLLALLFVNVVFVTVASADCLPGYVDSITPGTSVHVVFSSTGREPQVNTYNSPSTTGAEVARTHSDAYYNYYKAIYTTPGFAGAPLIGEYISLTGDFSQYTSANNRLQSIKSYREYSSAFLVQEILVRTKRLS